MGKAIPKRCPNCGSTNIHVQELESPHDLAELYDVFCLDCNWSGDISPDSPLESRQDQRSSSRIGQRATGKAKQEPQKQTQTNC